MPDREWSNAEKKIARRTYETAREAVRATVLAEFKARAAAVTTVGGMWSIVDELRQRRRELDELLTTIAIRGSRRSLRASSSKATSTRKS
jgi:hypothetical protein